MVDSHMPFDVATLVSDLYALASKVLTSLCRYIEENMCFLERLLSFFFWFIVACITILSLTHSLFLLVKHTL